MKLDFNNCSLAVTAGLPSQFPRDAKPQVAFSGRSNVGKSSLVNSLIGRKSLARVSSAPGKTITINFYDIGGEIYFVDLPGYGYAKRSDSERRRWSELVDGYLNNADRLKLVVQLVDMKVGATQDDMLMIDWMTQTGVPFVIVATKSDKLNKTQRVASLEKLSELNKTVIPFSSVKKEGKDDVISAIIKELNR